MRFLIYSFLLSILLGATGCTTAAVAVIDEKISQMTDKDCTTVNIMLGDDYCRDKNRTIKQEEVYCYRTLGGVDCYREKNPYNTDKSPRVQPSPVLGSAGAEVEYLGEKKKSNSLFNWASAETKKEKSDGTTEATKLN
ncbi:MAG: hypothetical protein JKY12_02495 [Sneathiella sp.]|nr:hypothetical protein [Sneathiella sp.]